MPVNRASPSPWPSLAAVLAVVPCVGAALAFAPWLDGYSHARHPLALLGAHGVPHATAFAALAYVLPVSGSRPRACTATHASSSPGST